MLFVLSFLFPTSLLLAAEVAALQTSPQVAQLTVPQVLGVLAECFKIARLLSLNFAFP